MDKVRCIRSVKSNKSGAKFKKGESYDFIINGNQIIIYSNKFTFIKISSFKTLAKYFR